LHRIPKISASWSSERAASLTSSTVSAPVSSTRHSTDVPAEDVDAPDELASYATLDLIREAGLKAQS